MSCNMMNIPPAIRSEAGIVNIHEMAMSLPTGHLTFLALSAAPTPTMLEAMTWVDEMGDPASVDIPIEDADTACESRPCTGSMIYNTRPSVRMILQPPISAPRPRAREHAILTQRGISNAVVPS